MLEGDLTKDAVENGVGKNLARFTHSERGKRSNTFGMEKAEAINL